MHRIISLAVVSMAIVLSAGTAGAAPLKWTLQNFVFDDGGTAAGSFEFDAATGAFSAIAVTTTAGSTRSGASHTIPLSGNPVLFYASAGPEPFVPFVTQRFFFALASAMTAGGGTIAVTGGYEGACDATCSFVFEPRAVLRNASITTAPSVPEPTALLLFGSSLSGVLVWRRRRTSNR